jgi:uncharacterized protein YkwD
VFHRRLLITFGLVLALFATFGAIAAAPPASALSRQQIAASVLSRLNHERKVHGLGPLKMNAKLVLSAHRHNLTMARVGELTHQAPGEAFFGDRIHKAGFKYSYAGENIGENTDATRHGALTLETMMYEEKPPADGHRRNILSKHFTYVGIDVVIDKAGRLWLTEDFARPV